MDIVEPVMRAGDGDDAVPCRALDLAIPFFEIVEKGLDPIRRRRMVTTDDKLGIPLDAEASRNDGDASSVR